MLEVAHLALLDALQLHFAASPALLDDIRMADVTALEFHRSAAAVAVLLKCKNLALHSRRSNSAASAALEAKVRTSVPATADGEVAAAVAAAPALHAHFSAAASATVASATAANLLGTLAGMPAISAGLRTRRRRNRQCGDARGKEQPGHRNSPFNVGFKRTVA
jgi:hypothetical protein